MDKGDEAVISSFLQFLHRQMVERPDQIVAPDAEQLRRIGELVAGVDVEYCGSEPRPPPNPSVDG